MKSQNQFQNQSFEESEDGYEIVDSEDYRSDKFQLFNHQVLIMKVLDNAMKAGCHEMRAGYFNTSYDKSGQQKLVYIEDTRKKFISCVETACNMMTCDFDKTAKQNISKLLKDLGAKKKKLLGEQEVWFKELPPKNKETVQMKYGSPVSGFFNIDLGWWQAYCEDELKTFREVLRELHSLTKRLDFYRIEEITG